MLHVAALGPNLRIDQAPARILDFDLTKLSQPPASPKAPAVPSDLTAALAAGSIVTEVHALAKGCGAVVIFVTASDGVRPLDHLVQRVEVVDGGAPTGDCFTGESSFESGLTRILALSGGPPADLGLQVIEESVGNDIRAAALLVDKAGNHWSWEMASSLAAYLGDKELLERSVDTVRTGLTSDKPLDYSAAGLELSKVIFSGKRSDQTKKAKDALDALRKRVDAGPTPTVLIRALEKGKNELFVPLRLITAKGKDAQFKGRLHVVHPLPHGESYGPKRPPCVENWSYAIPTGLGGSDLPTEIQADAGWLHPVDATIDALRNFFGRPPQESPEGLVLLSHHSTGAVWHRENADRLLIGELNHKFADGSIGVLLSCDVAAAREREMVLTRRLSTFGVDSLILSPFSLRATYGRAFSIGFAEAVQEARAAGNPATLVQLFDAAAIKARQRLKTATRPRDYGGMDLELILAGDHAQTLCVEENP